MTVLLSVQGLTKSFGARPLFSDLSFDLRAGNRIGLIGPNGSGKSTLLKLLTGLMEPDEGSRSQRRSARIGYLAQDDVFAADQTVRDVVIAGLAEESIEDHERETRIAVTLTQFGFDDFDQTADTLSGGWRKRLALAREIVRNPDLLLMDEPTNHLDLPGIVWMERLLRASSFGYVIATHDRTFLRAVADEIMEIGRVYPTGFLRVAGPYDEFVQRREEFLDAQVSREASITNHMRRETEWLGRQAKARTSKASFRIEEADRTRRELHELKYRNTTSTKAGIDFVATGRKSTKLLTAIDIAKSLGGRPLFAEINLFLSPGTKIGLLGPNGSGKTTLLRVLASEIAPDTGTVKHADNLRVVTFEQGRTALDPTMTLRQALCSTGDTVKYRERSLHVAAWAKRFLFQPTQLDLPIADLSGGEQARVRIAQLMLQPADLLLLDEPTNDLDIPALEVLENSLADFPGALVIISHDRDLMNRLCSEVIGLDGCGGSALYGNVNQWVAAYNRAKVPGKRTISNQKSSRTTLSTRSAPKSRKLNYQEKQELDGIEEAILTAEAVVAHCESEVERLATAGHIALVEACQALEKAQRTVERLYARWVELEAKNKN